MQKKRAFIIFIEVAFSLALIAFILYRNFFPWMIELPLEDFYSEYAEYDGNSIMINSENASGIIPKDAEVIKGPYLNLKPDSYTLLMDYEVDEEQPCRLLSFENHHSLKGNSFILYPQKTKLSYDFYCVSASKGINVLFLYSGNGSILLKSAAVIKNNHNLQILLFLWIILAVGFDLIVFSNSWIKKHKVTIMTIISISFLSSIPLLTEGLYSGHDYYFHQMRIEGIMRGLLNGEFPVRIESSFNSGYGYPVSVFYGSSLLYIAALFRIIGFSVTSSFKLFIIFINLLTSLITYLCCRCIFKKKETAYLVSAIYVLSSYRLVDIFVRSAVGEYSSFVFFPLIALSVWKIYTMDVNDSHYYSSIIPLTVGMLGLSYNHLLSLEIAGVILVCLALLFYKKTFRKKTLLVYIFSFILFLIGAAAFYIPFIDYYINSDILVKHYGIGYIQFKGAWFGEYFAAFKNPTGFAEISSTGRLSLTPGLPLIIGLFAAVYLIINKKADNVIKKLTLFSIGCLYLSSTAFPWNSVAEIPFLGTVLTKIQFPFRYLGIAILFLSLLSGQVLDLCADSGRINYRFFLTACFIVLLACTCQFTSAFLENTSQKIYFDTEELPQYTFYQFQTREEDKKDKEDKDEKDEDKYFCGGAEYNLIGSHRPDPIHSLSTENATAEIVSERGISMTIQVNADANAFVEIPRFNYLYYSVTDEQGKSFPIKNGYNNRIRISISEPYKGILHISFKEPWYWKLSEVISSLFFVLTAVILLVNRKKGKNPKLKMN